MTLVIGILLILGVLPWLVMLLWRPLRTYLKFRGGRVVACPENHQPAAVTVDAGLAAVMSISTDPYLRLRECTRWPEMEKCGQECLSQIEVAPEDCLIRNIVTKWYEGKTCAVCGAAIEHLNWHDRRAAIQGPDHITRMWSDVRADELVRTMDTNRPVCWNCHVAETFRRQHAELVTDRPRRG